MHWYFALSETSIDRQHHDWRNLIRVAVHSATINTTLKPHLIYDGTENSFIEELRSRGVEIVFHRTELYEALKLHAGNDRNYLRIASGAFLRFDIPQIEKSAEFVLYTDCDVIFRNTPKFFSSSRPVFFAATSQGEKVADRDMNSGVMLINVEGMRAIYPELIEFTQKNLSIGLDQEILRVFFSARYTPMDMSLNWKPYWGSNVAAQIIHFHGPKPTEAGPPSPDLVASWNGDWQRLYALHHDGYSEYFQLWQKMLASYNRESAFFENANSVRSLREELEITRVERDDLRSGAVQSTSAVGASLQSTEPEVKSRLSSVLWQSLSRKLK